MNFYYFFSLKFLREQRLSSPLSIGCKHSSLIVAVKNEGEN